MTYSAGFTYGIFGNTPVDKMYQSANLFQSESLHEMIDKLSNIPLAISLARAWFTASRSTFRAISSKSCLASLFLISCSKTFSDLLA
jgi:hypothetical protein